MNEQKVLIIIDQVDKTSQVKYYEALEKGVKVKYSRHKTEYCYPPSRIVIYESPVEIIITNQKIIYQNVPLQNISFVLRFNDVIKVFFENQQTRIFEPQQIRIIPNDEAQQFVDPLHYWMDISNYTMIESESESFLKKQFSALNVIHPESVLASYLQKSPFDKTDQAEMPIIYPFRFNLSQKKALEQALASKISIIEGPPGTGKTQTILNIIANLTVMHQKTVAVVSGNNAAVKNVGDKLQNQGYGFMVATLGKKDNRKHFFENIPVHNVDGWEDETEEEKLLATISDLTGRLDNLLLFLNRKAELEQLISALRLEQKHFKFHNDQQDFEGMKRLFLRNQTSDTVISFLADEYFIAEKTFRFLQKAKLLFKYGFIDFKNLKRNRVELITRMQMKYYETKLAELMQERDEIQAKLDAESFEHLLREHEQVSTKLFKKKIYHRYEGKQPYTGKEINYKDDIDSFMNYFPVMLSTTHALRSSIPDNYLLDYVIVDEASQVDLLTGALAMSCCKQMIIVGDMKQLPQIVDEKIEGKLECCEVDGAYNYFKHNLLSSVLAAFNNQVPKAMLKEHYRCHPHIIGFCNGQYYNNELVTMTKEKDSDSAIRLHYTAIGNHMRKVNVGKQTGNLNQREIEAVKEEILKELQLDNISKEDIGFTTPYRLQADEANALLNKCIEIDTVHKYQGREKPVMILSTVLDQTRNGQMGKKFVENPNLVNVAVSRAQKQFILVTDHALFRNSRKDIGNLIRYIEYRTLHEHVTHSQLISVFDLLYAEYSERLHELMLKTRLVNKSKYKSENIIWSILIDLMEEVTYKCFSFSGQVYLKDVFRHTDKLDEAEKRYIRNRASFDFVIYDALNKQPLMAIEVNGFAFHRNNLEQMRRDSLKGGICEKYGFPLLTLPTTGSNEVEKIRIMLDKFL